MPARSKWELRIQIPHVASMLQIDQSKIVPRSTVLYSIPPLAQQHARARGSDNKQVMIRFFTELLSLLQFPPHANTDT